MRVSHLASIVFACSISLFSTLSFAQSPVDDGVCDVLVGETPSLYGLCIAYWATQDNGNAVASSKILSKFTEASGPEGPGMPGLCPCWSETELEKWKGKVANNGDYCDPEIPANGTLYWGTVNGSNSLQTSDVGGYICKTSISGDLTENGLPINRPNSTGAIELEDEFTYEVCFTSLSSICPTNGDM